MAGIMGGQRSAVSAPATTRYLPGSGFFTPDRTGRQGPLATACIPSLRTASSAASISTAGRAPWSAPRQLLLDIVGGRGRAGGDRQSPPSTCRRPPVTLRAERASATCWALELPAAEVERILPGLGLGVDCTAPTGWTAACPAGALISRIEVDLIEELARVHGYDRLPAALRAPPLAAAAQARAQPDLAPAAPSPGGAWLSGSDHLQLCRSASMQALFDPRAAACAGNPISADMAVMRTTLWPGLVKAVQYNLQSPAAACACLKPACASCRAGRPASRNPCWRWWSPAASPAGSLGVPAGSRSISST